MARMNGIEKMSYAELVELRVRIDRLMIEKQNSARIELRQTMFFSNGAEKNHRHAMSW